MSARFLFASADPDAPPVTKVADATGFAGFECPGVAERLLRLEVWALAQGRGTLKAYLSPADSREVTFELLPLGVRGQVLGYDGRPLEGAGIQIPDHRVVQTDASGRFEVFMRFSEGEPLVLMVRHPGHLPRQVDVPQPTEGLVVSLERGMDVQGTVSFPDGRPVPGAALEARGLRWHTRAETGEDGRFLLSGLPAGPVKVLCVTTLEERSVEAGSTGVDFVLGDHLVRVRVLDEANRPFRRARLHVFGTLEGKTVAFPLVRYLGPSEGVVQYIGVRSGVRLTVVPRTSGFSRIPVEFTPEGVPRLHDLAVVLEAIGPPGTIEVYVRQDHGRPLPRVFLWLPWEEVPGKPYAEREVVLDGESRGLVEDVPPGDWTVQVRTARFWPPSEDSGVPVLVAVRVESGKTVRLEAVVRTGGRIRLSVRDADGEFVKSVPRLRDEGGREVPVSFMGFDKAGNTWTVAHFHAGPVASWPALPPGRYNLEVLLGDRPVASREVTVAPAGTVDVEITLDR